MLVDSETEEGDGLTPMQWAFKNPPGFGTSTKCESAH